MSDYHYPAGALVPDYARLCEHCKRPITRRARKYGSPACRQAAYRKRFWLKYVAPRMDNVTSTAGPAAEATGRQKQTPPPLVGKIRMPSSRPIGQRFRGKQKGGAA